MIHAVEICKNKSQGIEVNRYTCMTLELKKIKKYSQPIYHSTGGQGKVNYPESREGFPDKDNICRNLYVVKSR